MVAGTHKVNPSKSPGAHTLGFAHKTVIITGLTDDGRVVCKDNFGKEILVNASVQRAKGLPPQVGERWFIDRALGGWTLAACLSVPPPGSQVVTGLRPLMDPASSSLLDALVALGLVDDQTYGLDVVPRHVHATAFTATPIVSGNRTFHLALAWTAPTNGTPTSYFIDGKFYGDDDIGPLGGSFGQGSDGTTTTRDAGVEGTAKYLRVTVYAEVGDRFLGSIPADIAVPV